MGDQRHLTFTREEAIELLKEVARQGNSIQGIEQALVDMSGSMRRLATLEERISNLQTEVHRIDTLAENLEKRVRQIEAYMPMAKFTGFTLKEGLVKLTVGAVLVLIGYLLSEGSPL